MGKGVSSKSEKRAASFAKEVFGMALILFSVLALLCLVTGDALIYPLGGGVQSFLLGCFGAYSFILLVSLGFRGFNLVSGKRLTPEDKRATVFLLRVFAAVVFLIVHMAVASDSSLGVGANVSAAFSKGKGGFSTTTPGGAVASLVTEPIALVASRAGAFVILAVSLVVICIFLFRGRIAAFFGRERVRTEKPKREAPQKKEPREKEPREKAKSVKPVENEDFTPSEREARPRSGYFFNEKAPFEYKTKKDIASGATSRLSPFDGRFEFKKPQPDAYSRTTGSYSQEYDGKRGARKDYQPRQEEARRDFSEVASKGKPTGTVNLDDVGISPIFGKKDEKRGTEAGTAFRSDFKDARGSKPVRVVDMTERKTVRDSDRRVFTPKNDLDETPRDAYEERSRVEERVNDEAREERKRVFTPSYEQPVQKPESDVRSIREEPPVRSIREEPSVRREDPVAEAPSREQRVGEEVERRTPRVVVSPFGQKKPTEPQPSAVKPSNVTRDDYKQKQPVNDGSAGIEDMPLNYKYKAPPVSLLVDYKPDEVAIEKENVKRSDRAKMIVTVVKRVTGVDVKVERIIVGPSVTRYDVSIPDEVSPKAVFAAKSDLAFRLGTREVKMYNIPEESLIGIETANETNSIVGLKSVLLSDGYKKLKKKGLQFALGKDILGNPVILDLARMPHLIVSGATGMGKSVCLSSLLISLLYRYSPEEMRLIIIDPKIVEFNQYKGIPHLVFNDIIGIDKRAMAILEWAVEEMERRYQLLADNFCKDIGEYNESIDKTKEKKIPYIVILIDEFADLIMADEKNKKKIENYIGRLAQKARASGISLILATQRPSANIISGSIKTNVPSRICFKTSTSVDSRVVIDENGAEKLVCKGDCLYKTTDNGFLERSQCAFISNEEIKLVLDYVKANNTSYYDNKVLEYLNSFAAAEEGGGDDQAPQGSTDEVDEVMKKALRIVITHRAVSNSMLRTKLSIGYNRAATIIEWMARMNYVSRVIDNKSRTVLLDRAGYEELYGEFTEDF